MICSPSSSSCCSLRAPSRGSKNSISPFNAPRVVKRIPICVPSPPIHAPKLCYLQVRAGVGFYPASMSWWKKGEQLSNMRDITSSEQFHEALSRAAQQDKLVLVDFYSASCGCCKAIYPKICQIALENPDIEILKINCHENKSLCEQFKVCILPFFHFYRGTGARIDAFSCSLTKIDKLKSAVEKYQGDQATWAAR